MLAKYIIELALMEPDMVHYLPSKLSAAALLISMRIQENSSWVGRLTFWLAINSELTDRPCISVACPGALQQIQRVRPEGSSLQACRSHHSVLPPEQADGNKEQVLFFKVLQDQQIRKASQLSLRSVPPRKLIRAGSTHDFIPTVFRYFVRNETRLNFGTF